MESYIGERYLLSNNDILMYNRLSDKYDFKYISWKIQQCSKKLVEILDSDQLFPVEVYFRPKSYSKDTMFDFRPIHTASLLDQICMVCLLNVVMFNNIDGGKRELSELAKMIPHNFFGNIPSTSMDEIYEYWPTKYKEYNKLVEDKKREYISTKEYTSEICLDLKDFYPSINPAYILNLAIEKLSLVYKEDDDIKTLTSALTKLLYQKITTDLTPWREYYYKGSLKDYSSHTYITRGIAQGLPQSQFFGNLCMIDVARIIAKHFPGNSYYYVDDSVIFSNLDNSTFNQKLDNLNLDFQKISSAQNNSTNVYLNAEAYRVMSNMTYAISCNKEKSFASPLKDDSPYINLPNIARQVSNAESLADNIEDIDNVRSLNKIDIILDYLNNLLNSNQCNTGSTGQQTKFLKRYRKYFLFRKDLLNLRIDSDLLHTQIESFRNTYSDTRNLVEIFKHLDEDIFRAQYRLLCINGTGTNNIPDIVKNLETAILEKALGNNRTQDVKTYYTKDVNGRIFFQSLQDIRYCSLEKYCKQYCEIYKNLQIEKIVQNLHIIIETFVDKVRKYDHISLDFSDEFSRKILNALISYLFDVEISDSTSFIKKSAIRQKLIEVRILLYLRNRYYFKYADFKHFLDDITNDEKQGDLNYCNADPLLQNVTSIFIRHVKDPLRIDNLIVTHSIIKGLWMNGSKYLYSYTLHNEEHAVELIRQCVRICNTIDYLNLKQYDFYILFLACYIHDISMIMHPNVYEICSEDTDIDIHATNLLLQLNEEGLTMANIKKCMANAYEHVYKYFENKLRSNHHKDSAKFLKEHLHSYFSYLDDALAHEVAIVAESHGWNTDKVYGLKSSAKDTTISLKYMMILIRLADLMDMTKDRTNYFLLKENMKNLSLVSKFHWISHYITTNVDFTTTYHLNEKVNSERPICETISVDIYLNANYRTTVSCNYASCNWISSYNGLLNKIKCTEKEGRNCNQCLFMCRWMHLKNEWLFKELHTLKAYLNKVNSTLFHTDIQVNIIFKNERKLDKELYDDVVRYIMSF